MRGAGTPAPRTPLLDRGCLLHDRLTASALCRLGSMVGELHFAGGLAQDSREGRPQRRTVIIEAAMRRRACRSRAALRYGVR